MELDQRNLNPPGLKVYTLRVSMNLPLKDMTIEEKLAAMELLWDDLTRSPEVIKSPIWHKDILDERRQSVADGKAQFTDWDAAKIEIRKKLL
jgi:hypothetical protein